MIRRIINNSYRISRRKTLRKTQTIEESVIWNMVRNNKFGVRFKRQVSIGIYIADFYCSEKRLVIEIDGSQHLDSVEYDKERENYFSSLGIRTIRFWNNDIHANLESIYTKIESIINGTN